MSTLILTIIVVAAVYIYFCIALPIIDKRGYLVMEIKRACTEKEKRYWQTELKRLYLKNIPILKWFVD